MKSFVFTFIAFISLIVSAALISQQLHQKSQELDHCCHTLSISDEDYSNQENKTRAQEAFSLWESDKWLFLVFLQKDQVEKIDFSLCQVISSIESEDYSEYLLGTKQLCYVLNEIKKCNRISLEEIL